MFRLLYLTFFGRFRGTFAQSDHLHESPLSMKFPLIILAALAAVAGILNVPADLGGSTSLTVFLSPVFADSTAVLAPFHLSHSTEYVLMAVSAIASIGAAVYAYFVYVKKDVVPKTDHEKRGALATLSYNKFYVDDIYNAIIVRPLNSLSKLFYQFV